MYALYLCLLPLLLNAAVPPCDDAALQQRANEVHALVWSNFIQSENHLLLTRLNLAGRPMYLQGQRESPSLGDTSLYGGLYLDAAVRRAEVTHGAAAAACARALAQGILKNATVSPSPGLLARKTHPDGITYWSSNFDHGQLQPFPAISGEDPILITLAAGPLSKINGETKCKQPIAVLS